MLRKKWSGVLLNLLMLALAFAFLVVLFRVPLVSGLRMELPVWGYPLLGAVMGGFLLSVLEFVEPPLWRPTVGNRGRGASIFPEVAEPARQCLDPSIACGPCTLVCRVTAGIMGSPAVG